MKGIIQCLVDAVRTRRAPRPPDPNAEYVLLVVYVYPCRRPKARAYKMGESWYAHEFFLLPGRRIKLLPGGKVDGRSSVIEAWEPVTPNMVEFYHSAESKK